ncbi:hypothetical protein PJN14_30030, partial [Mycobacterium kansasii]
YLTDPHELMDNVGDERSNLRRFKSTYRRSGYSVRDGEMNILHSPYLVDTGNGQGLFTVHIVDFEHFMKAILIILKMNDIIGIALAVTEHLA